MSAFPNHWIIKTTATEGDLYFTINQQHQRFLKTSPAHSGSAELMSTQWAGAKITDDSGGAVPTQTPVATGQSDSGRFFKAHHAVFLSALICKSKHSHTWLSLKSASLHTLKINTNKTTNIYTYKLGCSCQDSPCIYQSLGSQWGQSHQVEDRTVWCKATLFYMSLHQCGEAYSCFIIPTIF